LKLESDTYRPLDRPVRLPDEIARRLAGDIRDGRYLAGEKLPSEHTLATSFAVSRNVVREAVSQLKHDGLVEARQGTGAFVIDPGQRSAFRISPECFGKRQALRQILELLAGVQAEAAALAAENRDEGELATLDAALSHMRACAGMDGAAGAEARLEAEVAFYRTIAGASRNVFIIEFVELLNRRVRTQLWSVAWKNTRAAEIGAAVLREHQRIHAAIRRGDAMAARAAAHAHFTRASGRLARRGDFAD
jgi:GntR family transcriptional regulator, transcriptional repressor for pyruvate dehydrogenase complex